MNEPKHTPGPWHACEDKYSKVIANNGFICDGFWWCGNTNEGIANARLCAAAPDMLEALEAIVDQDAKDWEDGNPIFGPALLQKVKNAIAKAKQP